MRRRTHSWTSSRVSQNNLYFLSGMTYRRLEKFYYQKIFAVETNVENKRDESCKI